jgi:phage shock protein C
MENKLYRDEQNKTIGGVCAGLSDYFNVDVSWVRVAFLVALTFGFGFMAYIILWIVVPAKNPFLSKPFVDYTVPPMSAPFAPAKRKPSNAAIVFGSILVVMGTLFMASSIYCHRCYADF